MKLPAILAAVLILLTSVHAQNWPDKIRGYKVYRAKVTVLAAGHPAKSDKTDAFVKIADLTIAEIGLSGATIEVDAEITTTKQSGSVELITFRDFLINGIAVEIEEYNHPISFKKGEPVALSKPVRILIRVSSLPRAVFKELTESPSDLSITGTALAFGKFKKFGFIFKRVVPIPFDLTIKNPLRS